MLIWRSLIVQKEVILSLISVISLSKWFWCAPSTVYGFPVYCRGGCIEDLFWQQIHLEHASSMIDSWLLALTINWVLYFMLVIILARLVPFEAFVQICEYAAAILWKASATHLHNLYPVQKFAKKLCDTISYPWCLTIMLLVPWDCCVNYMYQICRVRQSFYPFIVNLYNE